MQADSSAEQLAGAEEATCQLAQAAGLQKSSKQLPGQLLEAAITVEQLQGARAQLDGRCQSLDRQLAGADLTSCLCALSSLTPGSVRCMSVQGHGRSWEQSNNPARGCHIKDLWLIHQVCSRHACRVHCMETVTLLELLCNADS